MLKEWNERIIDVGTYRKKCLQVLAETINWRAPPTSKAGKKGKIYYVVQASVRPPTFVFFVNDASVFGEDYRRYVERQLRDNIGFPGSPIRIYWRGKQARPGTRRRPFKS